MRYSVRFLAAIFVLFGTAAVVHADVIANFNEIDAIDAFKGTPGAGWAGPWVEYKNVSAVTFSNTVLSDGEGGYNDLATGQGNYLKLEANISYSSGASAAVYRSYADGINLDQPREIEFLLRIDENLSGANANSYGRYEIHDRGDYTGTAGFGTSCSWGIRGSIDTDTPYWRAYNGTTAAWVDTDVRMSSGVAYSFTVKVDPSTETYDVSIVGDDGSSDSLTNLGWRSDAMAATGILAFCSIGKSGDSGVGSVRKMSVDAIHIAQIPEPSVIVMGLGLALAAVAIRRRAR